MRWVALAGMMLSFGCAPAAAFECTSDTSCGDGRCEATGYCSFPDDSCPSGRRYGELSGGGLAGQCVESEMSSGPTSTSGGSTTMTTSTSQTTSTSTTDPGTGMEMTTNVSESDSETSGGLPNGPHQLLISVDTTGNEADYVDYVVPVRLDPTLINFDFSGNQGEDLRFYDRDGTLLAHEVETWDDSAGLVWVKLPLLIAGGDEFELRVAEPGAPTALSAQDVWTDYVAVYHLNDPVTSNGDPVRDASASGVDGTANQLVDALTQGRFGGAYRFDGVTPAGSHIEVGSQPEVSVDAGQTLTTEMWFQRADTTNNSSVLLNHEACCLGYGILLRNSVGFGPFGVQSRLGVGCCTPTVCCGADEINYRIVDVALPDEGMDVDWHFFLTTMDRDQELEVVSYLDGQFGGTESIPVDPDPNFGALFIGSNSSAAENFNGIIDEVRMSRRTRSSQWVAFHHQIMIGERLSYGTAQPL